MYIVYVGIGVLLIIVLIGLFIRHVSYMFEAFQNQVEEELVIDLSGISVNSIDSNKLISEMEKLNLNTSVVDSRPVNDTSRICDTLQNQVNTYIVNKESYKLKGDWSNVLLSSGTIESLREQMSTLGCQNNNSQNS